MLGTYETEHSPGTATSEEERTVAALLVTLQAQLRQLEQQLAEIEKRRSGVAPTAE
jgi:hypothetical protein